MAIRISPLSVSPEFALALSSSSLWFWLWFWFWLLSAGFRRAFVYIVFFQRLSRATAFSTCRATLFERPRNARGQLGNPSPQGHARRSNFATRSSISPVSCALRHVSTKLATPAASPGVISPLATLATSAANTANIHRYQSVVLAQFRGVSMCSISRVSRISSPSMRRSLSHSCARIPCFHDG
jgi:hypothetical protein